MSLIDAERDDAAVLAAEDAAILAAQRDETPESIPTGDDLARLIASLTDDTATQVHEG
jgi:hypothetical protein